MKKKFNATGIGKFYFSLSESKLSSGFCIIAFSGKEEIQIIIRHWTRILNIKLGWINDFDKIVVNYVMIFLFSILFNGKYLFMTTILFMLDTFRSSSKLLKTFTGHTCCVNSIDYSIFDGNQFICSGSEDKTVCVLDVHANKQVQLFNGHLDCVNCVKFSQYHFYNYSRNVICSSSNDDNIRFWDFKDDKQFQIFNEHTNIVCGIEFSTFNGGRYLCSGSCDNTIRLWDVEISKSLYVFKGHEAGVWCVDIAPLQSNNNNSNIIGVIGGSGYTICSGSFDDTIRIWDIETTKQLIIFKGHKSWIRSVKYGSNEIGNIGCANTILSGSRDCSVRLWDIRSTQQIQVFNGHTDNVNAVEYSPFVVNNSKVSCSSNVICSGSLDNTIRFWDIRSNKKELHIIKGNGNEDDGIFCLKFLSLRNKGHNNKKTNGDYLLQFLPVKGLNSFVLNGVEYICFSYYDKKLLIYLLI
ncbi:WD-40 repeat-containing protein [Reticulomyxa filosa]|uniref:WD-40 repeat-containing protein n=1 Tax=Reticulomyxa filosa TaxID=46433 RepID=X6P0S2_RETFI|nr:WD-40 repeat-containing protein [Reticulomyxa filosa]|eukprot:ETO32165.1 WD-40 repeat-containing protein [Reticulomyxa filosa]